MSSDGSNRKWNSSVAENGYEILCVSQFTLYHTLKGNKPDFHHAMNPTAAESFYNQFLTALRAQYDEDKVKGDILFNTFICKCSFKSVFNNEQANYDLLGITPIFLRL